MNQDSFTACHEGWGKALLLRAKWMIRLKINGFEITSMDNFPGTPWISNYGFMKLKAAPPQPNNDKTRAPKSPLKNRWSSAGHIPVILIHISRAPWVIIIFDKISRGALSVQPQQAMKNQVPAEKTLVECWP